MIASAADRAHRHATDTGASVWVAASAGTGKTKILTDRVLALLLRGSAPQRILGLTFTKAAAAEMSIRLGRRLSEWATVSDTALVADLRELTGEEPSRTTLEAARRLFARLLDAPGGMRIDTIHAFCQSILRRFPIEAGVAPNFDVMDERSAAEAMAEARTVILDDDTYAGDIAEIASHVGEGGFAALIGKLAAERARLRRDFLADGIAPALGRLRDLLGITKRDTPAAIVAAACSGFDDGLLLVAARALIADGGKDNGKLGRKIAEWLEQPALRPARFDTYLGCYFTDEGTPRRRLGTKSFREAHVDEAAIIDAEADRLAEIRDRFRAASLYAATAALVRVGDALLREYERHKAARALLDYDDLILHTRDLLRRPGVAPWVLYKLDGGLDHILIDEAQDTNPEQWEVIEALAAEFFSGEGARQGGRTIFAVGDMKQSIFSFQRADPLAFARMRAHFAARIEEAKWHVVDLGRSFRSTPAVLRAVDAVFSRPVAAKGVIPDGTRLRHEPVRVGMAGRVELWPPVPAEKGDPESAWELPRDRRHLPAPPLRLARAVAAQIKNWIGKERLEARGRAVAAGDILVLVRRRNAFLVELVRALKDLKVPVAGADRMRLTEQLAVEDLIALGNFLLLPEDELTLACVLKGPLYDFDDDLLYKLAQPRTRSLWAELRARAREDDKFARAAAELAALLAQADFIPPYELFAQVLSARGGRRAVLRRLGPDAADPLDEFLSAALHYEGTHGPSLQGFLAWLQAGEVQIKRDFDQRGRDEVRIMTVHGAKGLQAPIVILPDTLQMPKKVDEVLWTPDAIPLWCGRAGGAPCWDAARQAAADKRDDEYRRLLYVAMTRAEDRLYICGWNTKISPPPGNWFELAKDGLASLGDEIETVPFESGGADGWSGVALRLESKQTAPAQMDAARADHVSPEAAPPEWLRVPPKPEPMPPRPLTPSRPRLGEPPARSPLATVGNGDPFKRGRLVHRLLQSLPELPRETRAEAARRYLALAVHGLLPNEREGIIAETLTVLDHPDFAPLFGLDSRAEVPIVALLGDRAISGQIDRLVALPDRILIVDYKTLRPPPRDPDAVPAAYLEQLAAYRAAIAAIYPGRAVDAALLWTEGPDLMPIPAVLLDRHAPGAGPGAEDAGTRP